MIEIKTLTSFDEEDLNRIVTAYSSSAKYTVSKVETVERTTITLELVPLEPPAVRRYSHFDGEMLERYRQVIMGGLSVGAYAEGQLIGFALAERYDWNNSLWVWEFHISASQRRQGIGTGMMEVLAQRAQATGLRVIICETQSANVPAIQFYRSVGFEIDGIDLSYYSNSDVVKGEVAIFMKRKIFPAD